MDECVMGDFNCVENDIDRIMGIIDEG